jgi:DNA-directed RNA polymerase specialized sigma24 family protein
MVKMRDKPCEKCGWKYPSYHLCLSLPETEMRRVGDLKPARVRKATGKTSESDDQVSNVRLRDAQFKERNKRIVQLYTVEQMSMREIAKELLLDDSTVMNILHAAKDRGEITIRKTARRTVAR